MMYEEELVETETVEKEPVENKIVENELIKRQLIETARDLVDDGKGILAIDEPTGILGSFFADTAVVTDTTANRRRHMEMLLTCDPSLADFISGVILLPEALQQTARDGTPFIELLNRLKIIAGVKVDEGIIDLEGSEIETTTRGLDNLPARAREFKKNGARFAKWRCCFRIGENTPSARAIRANTEVLARYAKICQEIGLMPLVEPEVMCDGDHDLGRAQEATETVLDALFKALGIHQVRLEGMLLKCSMVIPGHSCVEEYSPEQIGKATIEALSRTVPAAMPGVTFLSGGQSEIKASTNLNAINLHRGPKPWKLSFSFGRALQATVMRTWAGLDENVASAQRVLLRRARANSRATLGRYTPQDEDVQDQSNNTSLFVPSYTY